MSLKFDQSEFHCEYPSCERLAARALRAKNLVLG